MNSDAASGWPRFPDPATLPIPRRDLWDARAYTSVWVCEDPARWHALFPPVAMVRSSFGCKMKCSFCVVPYLSGGCHLPRPVEAVVEEIAGLEADHVYFCDDENFIDEAFASELAEALAARGVRKRYFAWTRSTTVNRSPELMRSWRRIGLDAAFLGFEFSTDDELQGGRQGRQRGGQRARLGHVALVGHRGTRRVHDHPGVHPRRLRQAARLRAGAAPRAVQFHRLHALARDTRLRRDQAPDLGPKPVRPARLHAPAHADRPAAARVLPPVCASGRRGDRQDPVAPGFAPGSPLAPRACHAGRGRLPPQLREPLPRLSAGSSGASGPYSSEVDRAAVARAQCRRVDGVAAAGVRTPHRSIRRKSWASDMDFSKLQAARRPRSRDLRRGGGRGAVRVLRHPGKDRPQRRVGRVLPQDGRAREAPSRPDRGAPQGPLPRTPSPTSPTGRCGASRRRTTPRPRPRCSLADAFKLALDSEKRAQEYYATALQQALDPTVAELFEDLRKAEVEHQRMLEAEQAKRLH